MSVTILNTNKLEKSLRREKKRNKKKYGMQRDGDSVKIIQKEQQKRRDKVIKKRRKVKEEYLEGKDS